ncbi:MAG: hypothetical protein SFZ24_10075 [Planctomycetota bacterium]|nr:hypothetical protein [Planctomycetota bacterium]
MFSFNLKLALLGLLSASATVTVGGCSSGRAAREEDEVETVVTLADLPPAARATIEREAMGHAITEVEREEQGGRITYSADTMIDGKPYDIEVTEAGVLLTKELEEEDSEDGSAQSSDSAR